MLVREQLAMVVHKSKAEASHLEAADFISHMIVAMMASFKHWVTSCRCSFPVAKQLLPKEKSWL